MKKMLFALLLALLPMKAHGMDYDSNSVLELMTSGEKMVEDLKAHNCFDLTKYLVPFSLYGFVESKVKYIAPIWVPNESGRAIINAGGLPYIFLLGINAVSVPAQSSFAKDYSCKIEKDMVTLYFEKESETLRLEFSIEQEYFLQARAEGRREHGKNEDAYYSTTTTSMTNLFNFWLTFLARN